jgi:hypothetical protein
MKKPLRLVSIISAFLCLQVITQTSFPAFADTVVIGKNNPAQDVQAVQRAVDQGGIISLKGAFDFGNEGRVNITKDAKIIGETDGDGKPATKISGGFWTLHSPLPAALPPEAFGPKITIQNIHFDGALMAPVCLAYSSGATISNNRMTNIRPRPLEKPLFGKSGLNMQQGIVCWGAMATGKYIPNLVTGNLIIEDNDIEMTNDVPTKTMAQGVFTIWTTGINARIHHNTVINCTRNSIEALDNYRGKDGSGLIVIEGNNIITATEGVPVPSPSTPNGVIIGWFMDTSGGMDPARNIKYLVLNNGIRTRGKTSVGIGAFTDGVVIATNGIFSEEGAALPIFLASSDGYVAYNRMEGTSSNPAIVVRSYKLLKGSKNVFVGNDLKQFTTSSPDVVIGKGSCDNFFIGAECKVSDLGSNNSIQVTK